MNYTSITLGELLSSENETIKRNAVSILKVLQKQKRICLNCGTPLTQYEIEQYRNKNNANICERCWNKYEKGKLESKIIEIV